MNMETSSSISAASPLERLGTLVIKHPQFNSTVKAMQRCIKLTNSNPKDPVCMSLEALPGAGKTTILDDFVAVEAPQLLDTGTYIPYFKVATPSPVTVKGMASEMLRQIGDPAFDKGSLSNQDARLVQYILDCRVKVVFLDDFHQLIELDTDKVLNQVSDWLKVLIKSTMIPFVVTGDVGKVSRILNKNPQLSRLFGERRKIEPFKWDNLSSQKEFFAFITLAQQQSTLKLPNNIPWDELVYRMYFASDGIVGWIMNLLRYSAVIAEEQQTNEITLEMMAIAFDTRLRNHLNKLENPFETSPRKQFTPRKDH